MVLGITCIKRKTQNEKENDIFSYTIFLCSISNLSSVKIRSKVQPMLIDFLDQIWWHRKHKEGIDVMGLDKPILMDLIWPIAVIIGIMILYKDTKNVFTFNNIKTENERI